MKEDEKWMENIKSLFTHNSGRKVRIEIGDKRCIFHDETGVFSGETIIKILYFISSMHQTYKGVNIPVVFSLGKVKIADKLSYILFECICYSLMNDYHHRVFVYWKPRNNILTDGVFCSPLVLLNDSTTESKREYLSKFNMEIYKNHFRRVVNGKQKGKTNYLGDLLQQLDSFLKYFDIVKEYRDQITEVITELVGNACEHAKTECLLDIDITEDYSKKVKNIKQEGKFYGINIVIINFSEILLGTDIKKKMLSQKATSKRYIELEKAYQFHKCQFSKEYTESDFYNLAALQDKISGRLQFDKSGGTGLTLLIRSLQEKSDMDSCYVATGDRCIFFYKELLKYNEQNWLGFNKTQDFFRAIPEKEVIRPCYAYIPGTAFNLNFVMRGEDFFNEKN